MPSDPLPEPWHSFLRELDTQLARPTELHCFGGFVVAQCYGLMRPTADIDIFESKGTDLVTLAKLAGRTSPLYKRHGVYIDIVTVADVPDNYEERLITALDASFEKLQFRIFERHDLVLAKIVRNNDRDRADVGGTANGGVNTSAIRALDEARRVVHRRKVSFRQGVAAESLNNLLGGCSFAPSSFGLAAFRCIVVVIQKSETLAERRNDGDKARSIGSPDRTGEK